MFAQPIFAQFTESRQKVYLLETKTDRQLRGVCSECQWIWHWHWHWLLSQPLTSNHPKPVEAPLEWIQWERYQR
ncbi:hypothetical protein M5D96_007850 [Drosophila gunungcola]|uniref:Uncharacterized protein n=1 Tax=Drosophila gunungcola TaxID=103775 RepID=A0A9P9YLW2_9MUSC|nr:hypothetical protein M5D96_007850 [Drosophila gunungcola]